MTQDMTLVLEENKRITREEVAKCVKAIRKLIDKNKDIVKIEFTNKESNDKYNINFNGYGKNAHETFIFYSNYKENIAEEIIDSLEDNENNNGNIITANGVLKRLYLVTNRKPYAKIVKQAFMKLQEITNNKFDIYCDSGYMYYKDKIILNNKTFKSLEEIEKLNKKKRGSK